MLLGDFQYKLQKLNPRLYIRTEQARTETDGSRHAGLYLKEPERMALRFEHDLNLVHHMQERYLKALAAGELDRFICGVCIDDVPEYDRFNLESDRIQAPGWRTVSLSLVKKQICSLARVRKVFNCASLGEFDYDQLKGLASKLDFIRKRNHA